MKSVEGLKAILKQLYPFYTNIVPAEGRTPGIEQKSRA